tara:strand:- start:182 stop:538 length:357 start_codon:yes stop_codon:yes gene_type:complete
MNSSEFPYSVNTDDKPINFKMNTSDQMAQYKNDEKYQKAPPTVPFDIEAMNSKIGDMFVSLAELRNMLMRLTAQPIEGPTEVPYEGVNKGAVDNITNKIDKINEIILDIPEDLAKIAI